MCRMLHHRTAPAERVLGGACTCGSTGKVLEDHIYQFTSRMLPMVVFVPQSGCRSGAGTWCRNGVLEDYAKYGRCNTRFCDLSYLMFIHLFIRSAAERVPEWSVHVGQNGVLEDDVVFLHAQEQESVKRGGEPFIMSAVCAFRCASFQVHISCSRALESTKVTPSVSRRKQTKPLPQAWRRRRSARCTTCRAPATRT